MTYAYFILAMLALFAATYVNIITFFIVHRMKKSTPWGLALSIIGVAAMGSYTWLRAFSYISCVSDNLPIGASLVTIVFAVLFAVFPRIEVDPGRHIKVH